MPVASKTRQPQGLLSGGDSVALAETVGNMAANLSVDQKKHYCLGLEINVHHIRRGEVCVRCSQTALYR
jgi:1,4-dihydroxy-2-naphthoyl-CoA hydrolase